MNLSLGWLVPVAVAAALASPSVHPAGTVRLPPAAASPCAADSSYQRLAFWVGDWDVYDSTGAHYATQRVQPVVDGCAFSAEWTGRVGDKGTSISAFDRRTGDWKQVYVSNQVPAPFGVALRKSDPAYDGPGVRWISLLDPSPGDKALSRITIMPLTDHRAMQLFESSRDGGATWRVMFKAEHRRQAPQ